MWKTDALDCLFEESVPQVREAALHLNDVLHYLTIIDQQVEFKEQIRSYVMAKTDPPETVYDVKALMVLFDACPWQIAVKENIAPEIIHGYLDGYCESDSLQEDKRVARAIQRNLGFPGSVIRAAWNAGEGVR